MARMRPVISILCSEMDGTPLIRDHALARMLQDQYEVHLVGFSQSGEVWGPLANEPGMDYRPYSAPTALKVEGSSLPGRPPHPASVGPCLLVGP